MKENVKIFLLSLRPYQWIKNFLIFLPILATHETSFLLWKTTILTFFAFCLIASSSYIINDLFDLESDIQHPIKSKRPLASGKIEVKSAIFLAIFTAIIGFSIIIYIGKILILILIISYYILTNLYSRYFKNFLALDICLLASFYTLRVFIGWVASYTAPLSVWLFAFSMFLFLGLASIKRQSEISYFNLIGRKKIKGRPYEINEMVIMASTSLSAGYISTLIFALYISSPQVYILYESSYLLYAICPILLYWILRLVILSFRGKILEDPILFSIKDKTSLLCLFLVFFTFLAAKLINFKPFVTV